MATINLDHLEWWADFLGVKVCYTHLPKGMLGRAHADIKVIKLDKSLKVNNRLLKCVMAEEIGHILYPPRPGHVRYHSKAYWQTEYVERSNLKVIVAQDERAALDWATGVLMPDVEFWRAVSESVNTIPQLIEYFDVEDWIVRHKVGHIRRQARSEGRRLKWRDIIKR